MARVFHRLMHYWWFAYPWMLFANMRAVHSHILGLLGVGWSFGFDWNRRLFWTHTKTWCGTVRHTCRNLDDAIAAALPRVTGADTPSDSEGTGA